MSTSIIIILRLFPFDATYFFSHSLIMRIEKVIILFVAVVSFILATPQDGKANLMLVGGGLDDNPIIYPKIVQLAVGYKYYYFALNHTFN